MNPRIQLKTLTPLLLVVLLLACFGLLLEAHAVVPPPDGGYPGGNTAEGQSALFSLTTGHHDTAVGFLSLRNVVTGSYNTAIGAGTLLANTADQNTATGFGALLSNTTGIFNTANGALALFYNITGNLNTASGWQALFSNTTASNNTATGVLALFSNTTGEGNTAFGQSALRENSTGGGNTAIGSGAGLSITGAGNLCIGAGVFGVAGVHNTTWIKNVYASVATTRAVFVDSDGKLGTLASSRRFKDEIKSMGKTSEAILALKPVTFRYKQEIDSSRAPQFGLVAEEVAKVNPDLVVRDEKRDIYSVRYDAVNAMLLNEFLKEHKAFEREQQKVEQLEKQVEALTAGLQRVSAQLEVSKPAPQTVLNNQ
jgi:hypothetical protein